MAKHPGSITRRSGAWRIRLCVGGKYHSFTVHGTKVEAENFAKSKHEELSGDIQRAKAGLPGPLSFSALLRQYEEYELPQLAHGAQLSYQDTLKPLRVFFVQTYGDPLVRQIQRSHVKTYLEWRRTHGILSTKDPKTGEIIITAVDATMSNHTVARDRRVLHRLFNYALEKDLLDANPCARVRAPKGDPHTPTILSADDYDKLIEACEDREMLKLYVLILGETGARCESEALRLRWEGVDLAGGFIEIRSGREGHRTKSGKSRWVPLTPRLDAALRDHFARYRLAMYGGQRSPWVLHHTLTQRHAKAGDGIKSLRDQFLAALKRAGLPPMRQHDLRHRRVTKWLAEGASPALVREAMGHADMKTTLGYAHLAREHLRALVQAPVTLRIGEQQA